MKETPPKIAQLVAAAKTELNRLGVNTDGKRSDELLTMARGERNNTRTADQKHKERRIKDVAEDFAP